MASSSTADLTSPTQPLHNNILRSERPTPRSLCGFPLFRCRLWETFPLFVKRSHLQSAFQALGEPLGVFLGWGDEGNKFRLPCIIAGSFRRLLVSRLPIRDMVIGRRPCLESLVKSGAALGRVAGDRRLISALGRARRRSFHLSGCTTAEDWHRL